MTSSLDQNARVRPAPVAVDDPEFFRQARVGLNEEGLEKPLIRFDLPLEFLVLLWPDSWLIAIQQRPNST